MNLDVTSNNFLNLYTKISLFAKYLQKRLQMESAFSLPSARAREREGFTFPRSLLDFDC